MEKKEDAVAGDQTRRGDLWCCWFSEIAETGGCRFSRLSGSRNGGFGSRWLFVVAVFGPKMVGDVGVRAAVLLVVVRVLLAVGEEKTKGVVSLVKKRGKEAARVGGKLRCSLELMEVAAVSFGGVFGGCWFPYLGRAGKIGDWEKKERKKGRGSGRV
ncbi:hypothetical protein HAX54_012940 [Datura stramonium]|uniref:Uncharacterized protein n=1 Tax=Datura stramonium TaxID=4076 RepID=A0ABS8Y733_DATST|nr:hypothetical protein [Datura stramonium]